MNNGLSTVLICGYPDDDSKKHADYLGMHYLIYVCNDPVKGLKILDDNPIDLILAHHQNHNFDAISFLKKARINHPETVRILVGDLFQNEINEAINQAAIYQFLSGDSPTKKVELHVKRAMENRELGYRHRHLSRELKIAEDVLKKYDKRIDVTLEDGHHFEKLVYCSRSMAALCNMAKKASKTNLPILIQGATGTGKELMARAIHHNSDRNNQPLMVHNCGGMSDELLHSELFGHVKGAYTGAVGDRLGLLPAADGGTVFLDEIGDVSPAFQVSLLRFLQEGEVKPLGSDKIIHCDVRVIAASNRPVEGLIKTGEFREDLYYRLNGFQLNIPPLSTRLDDIELLTEYLAKRYARSINRKILGVAPEVIEKFQLHSWPGNVRELENEIKRMVAITDKGNFITTESLSPHINELKAIPQLSDETLTLDGLTLKQKVEKLEVKIISKALQQFRWNQSKVAKELGLSRMGLSNKIKRYNISSDEVSA